MTEIVLPTTSPQQGTFEKVLLNLSFDLLIFDPGPICTNSTSA